MDKFRISQATVISCAILIIVGLGSYWFFSSFDKVPFQMDRGFSEEARRNPFLAAQQFLKKQTIDFERRNNFKVFDGELGDYDTVIINSSRVGMSTAAIENMRQWVEGGGHLVLLATEAFDYELESSRDDFLDSLGLRFYSDTYETSYDESRDEKDVAQFEFNGYDEPSRVEFSSTGYIEDTSGEASFVAGTEYADQLIQYQVREGLITVAIDFSIWNNYRIDEHDHAMFLTQLIGESEKAWLLYNRVQPSLLRLAVAHSPMVVVSTLVLLLAVLWSQLWRVGPKRKDEQAINREIMQHLSASAEFNYRLDRGEKMIGVLMSSIHSRMAQLSHGYDRLTPAKKIDKVAIHTGLPVKKLSILLSNENESEEIFLDKVKLIQEIRTHL